MIVSHKRFHGHAKGKKEPRPVRFYNHPRFNETMICPHCDCSMQIHGWLDFPPNGQVVCPGMYVILFGNGQYLAVTEQVFRALQETT